MNYKLSPLPSLAPTDSPDLREMLVDRRSRSRDVRASARDARFLTTEDGLSLQLEGRVMPITAAAKRDLVRRNAPEEWLAGLGDVFVRTEDGSVRAILPGRARKLDSLELLDAVLEKAAGLSVRP